MSRGKKRTRQRYDSVLRLGWCEARASTLARMRLGSRVDMQSRVTVNCLGADSVLLTRARHSHFAVGSLRATQPSDRKRLARPVLHEGRSGVRSASSANTTDYVANLERDERLTTAVSCRATAALRRAVRTLPLKDSCASSTFGVEIHRMNGEQLATIHQALVAVQQAVLTMTFPSCDQGDVVELIDRVESELHAKHPNITLMCTFLNSIARSLRAQPEARDACLTIEGALGAAGVPSTWQSGI